MTGIIGLILAGGQARRLGGAGKADLILGTETLLHRTIARLKPQCSSILLNLSASNRLPKLEWPVVHDGNNAFEGPLSGLLAGMDWVADHAPDTRFVLTVPVDSPFFPLDLCNRLTSAASNSDNIATAISDGRIHPLHAVWPMRLHLDLRTFTDSNIHRKVTSFQDCYNSLRVNWNCSPVDPFFNINTPYDLDLAREIIVANPNI